MACTWRYSLSSIFVDEIILIFREFPRQTDFQERATATIISNMEFNFCADPDFRWHGTVTPHAAYSTTTKGGHTPVHQFVSCILAKSEPWIASI